MRCMEKHGQVWIGGEAPSGVFTRTGYERAINAQKVLYRPIRLRLGIVAFPNHY